MTLYLKIKRVNSEKGSWKCIEMISGLDRPLGIGRSIEEALEDYLQSYRKKNGFTPDYKWS